MGLTTRFLFLINIFSGWAGGKISSRPRDLSQKWPGGDKLLYVPTYNHVRYVRGDTAGPGFPPDSLTPETGAPPLGGPGATETSLPPTFYPLGKCLPWGKRSPLKGPSHMRVPFNGDLPPWGRRCARAV